MTHAEQSNRGRLNVFQRAMLQWNDLCPYNATHVVRIPAVLDAARLEQTIRHVLAAHRLGEALFDRKRGVFSYEASPGQLEINRIEGNGTFEALSAEIERQLNRRFPFEQKFSPIRFFFTEAENSFVLGLVYFHPIADAESVVMLLKDIVSSYLESSFLPTPFDIFPARRDRLRDTSVSLLSQKLGAAMGIWRQMSVSDRFSCRDVEDFTLGFSYFTLDARILNRLSAAAKTWKVTINDLFLAMLLQCLSPFGAARVNNSKRRNISVGCIVNLRRDLALPNPRTFGLFLGSFAVTHEVPAGITLEKIAREIAIQTRRFKDEKLYLGIPLQMAIGRAFLSLFSLRARRRFYAKQYPLYGGVTNMNLNALWSGPVNAQPLNYFRAVSAGPVTPLVLSITTAGETIHIGMSHRISVFSKEDALQIRTNFERLARDLKS